MDNKITIKSYAECCDQSEEFQFELNDGLSLYEAMARAKNWVCGCKQTELDEEDGYDPWHIDS